MTCWLILSLQPITPPNHLSVYIWTLLGLSWLGGLISLIVDSASKVALKTRPDTDSIEYKLDCGRYVNNVRVVLGRNGSQPNNTTTQQPNNSRENNIVMATRNFPNYKAPPDVVNQSGQLKKTKNTNFKNREEKNCIICSESEHLCKQHRILLDPWYHMIIHFQVQIGFPVINHFNKPLCIKK